MSNVTKDYVRKLFDMSCSEIPEKILNKAKICFFDYLAVTLGGCDAYKKVNELFLEQNRFSGELHIIGSDKTADLNSAVMINAYNAHVLELDDSHRVAMTHLGAPIFSALLGAAELYQVSYDKFISSAVVAYDAAIRLAEAIQPSHKKRGFHVSGTCCTVGCAMGIAAMLGYSLEEMENTFCAAVTSAAGLLGVISGKSEQKPYNVANAAVSGVNAALYGRYFHSADDILCNSRGFMRAVCDEYNTDALFREGYAIEGIYQKLYAACRHCHAPMEAMLNIKAGNSFNVGDIRRIEVKTYDLAITGHDHTDITCVSSAKQSIPYGVSAACILQNCGVSAFTEKVVGGDAVNDIVKKVSVSADPELSALVPAKRAAVVSVYLNDGTCFSKRVDYPKGEPENPITEGEMKEKFHELVQNIGLTSVQEEKINSFVFNASDEPVSEVYSIINNCKENVK